MTTILELDKVQCVGCGLCTFICPKGIVQLKEDDEGFSYPTIEDVESCVHCSQCIKYCPASPTKSTDLRKDIPFDSAVYAYDSDDNRLKKSASGGIAAGLYRAFLEQENSCIVGVRYSDDYKNVEYDMTDKPEDIVRFCGSKYVKADTKSLFTRIEKSIKEKKNILVVGLPCEIAAIRNRFKDSPYLYLVELICHGPTSHIVLTEYLKNLEKKQGALVCSFTMRGKNPYWKPYYIMADFENGQSYAEKFLDSNFSFAFEVLKRPSCNTCHFKDNRTSADLVIGDFHAAEKGLKEYNPYGVSEAFPIGDKGKYLIDCLKKHGYSVGPADKTKAMGNMALIRPIERLHTRSRFSYILQTCGLERACADPFVKADRKLNKIKNKAIAFVKRRLG